MYYIHTVTIKHKLLCKKVKKGTHSRWETVRKHQRKIPTPLNNTLEQKDTIWPKSPNPGSSLRDLSKLFQQPGLQSPLH